MLVFFINVYTFQAATTPIFLNCLLICCCGLYPPHVFGRRNNTPHDICVFKWSNCSAGLRLSIRCLFSTLFVFNQWNVYCVWVYDSPRANGWSTFLPINMTMPRERLCVLSNWIIYTQIHIYIRQSLATQSDGQAMFAEQIRMLLIPYFGRASALSTVIQYKSEALFGIQVLIIKIFRTIRYMWFNLYVQRDLPVGIVLIFLIF